MKFCIISSRAAVLRAHTVLLLLVVLAAGVPAALGQAATQGSWSTLSYLMPINPVHVALLNNGKVLIVSGSGNVAGNTSYRAGLWDPQAGTITTQALSWDMFCNGMTTLADGRVLIAGGTLQYDPFYGQVKTAIYDPTTNTFTNAQNMAHGRWYPTVTELSDGRVMVFSGLNETGSTNPAVEIYTVGSGWSTQYNTFTPPLYPWMHLLPSGNVFFSGATALAHLFNPTNQTWSNGPVTNNGGTRTYGSSLLLPLTPANNYDPKIMILGGTVPTAVSTTEIIDLGASNPAWAYGPDMSAPRVEMDAVLLPNGKVLAVGGSASDEVVGTATLNADIFDPAAASPNNVFKSAGSYSYARVYHTVALLMPDATVWLAGGNPVRGTYEQHMEIYSPAYLFNSDGSLATRPTISSAPTNITWNTQFAVSTPDAANIGSAVLMRPGSSTHAFDMSARMVGLTFTAGSGMLTVTGPPSANVAPPGYYMLFLLNNSGVPSVAKFVLLNNSPNPAPTVSSISPVSGTTAGGTAVTITGTGFLTGATVKLGGTSATGVSVSNSTTITATTAAHAAGAVDAVVTNTDAQSGTLSQGYTYTTPVNPAPTVSSISPVSGTTAGGTPVTITGTGFLAGATVSFGGTPATGVGVSNSTTITATTPAHAAGAVNVVVTNTDAQSGTLTNGYTYTTSGGGGNIAFVQSNSGPATIQASNTTVAVTYAVAQTAGDTNVVVIGWGDTSSTINSVTDNKLNSYALAVGPTSGTGLRQSIYYAPNIAGGSTTVTVTFSKAAAYPDVRILEYTGLDPTAPLDKAVGTAGTGTAANSGSVSTTAASELIFGAGTSGTRFSAAGSGFTSRMINLYGNIAEDKTVNATGNYNATATDSSGVWVMQVATFRAGGQGPPPPPAPTSISPTSGTTAGGTAVTITGTGFLTGATVTFGGTAATGVSVSNSTTITATTAAHAAGAVDVVVTNTDAQSGTLSQGYTYTTPNPAPTVSSISPVSGTTAGGTAVTITGTGFLTGATVKLGGTSATGVSVSNSTTITATTAAHAAGAVDAVVTNTDAQSGTLSQGYTYTTPVNPAPTVSSISPVSGTTAGGTPVTITGTGFLAGATVSFGGTPATGVGVSNSTTITATTPAHAAGAVNVVVTNTDAQSGTLTNGYTYTTSGGGGNIAFVQSNSGPATIQASNTTVAVTYAVAQTAGDTNVVVIGWGDTSSTINSVTDNKLNSYALAVGPTSGTGLRQSIYYAPNIAGGSTTVTVTFSKAAAYPDVRILEYTGLDPTAPLDKAVGTAGTGTAANSGSVSTTAASELIFGAGTSGTRFSAAGSGFTSRMINLYGNIAEDKTVNATGNYNATATDSSGVWVMQVAAFKAAP